MYKNVELRKLPADAICNIVDILEINSDWKRVMSIIPKYLQNEDFEPKYNNEQIRTIEEYAKTTNQKCTDILLDEWGTSGRVRPTLATLKTILEHAQIYRAADEIAIMLNEPLPERPSNGPAAPISMNLTEILNGESTELEDEGNYISAAIKSKSDPICNGSTKRMKSVSDMILFPDSNGNDISASKLHQSVDNKTTAEMKCPSNLITLPKEEPTQESMNIPRLSLLCKSSFSQEMKSIDTLSTDFEIPKLSSTQSDQNIAKDFQTSFPNINVTTGIDSVILQDANLIHFDYGELDNITGNFSDCLIDGPEGLKGRIGSGGFGDVFVGKSSKYGWLAVKKVHNYLATQQRRPDMAMRTFNAEVKYLSQFRHINIVPILGFSMNGPAPCIVCEYIEGGSLLENIAAKILDEPQRINTMVGTAEGLKYLHTSEKPLPSKTCNSLLNAVMETDSQNSTKNFVHGDVKSANILLTNDCVPKLCDFGLAKQYDSTFVTTNPMGTSAYMAPEGLHGTITQKIDIFSFGIVLLELLTGLKPIISNGGENLNIKHYVEEYSTNNNITPLLDPVVKNWKKADDIYKLATMCLEYNRKSRPDIAEVCDILNTIKQ